MAITSGTLSHAFIIDIVPSKGPNGQFSTATFNSYAANAVNSLENSLGTLGDISTDPTAYVPKTEVSSNVYQANATELIVSTFPSWDAQASPTGNFTGQTGNRIYFGVRIRSEGTQFALHNLQFDADSNDVNNSFDTLDRNFNGENYTARRIGIDYVDGIKGNGNDIVYTNNLGSLAVDELIYVGEDFANGSNRNQPTDQENLDFSVNEIDILAPFSIFGTYTLFSDSSHTLGMEVAMSTAQLHIPEPSSMLLLTAGLLVIPNRWPRKTRQA